MGVRVTVVEVEPRKRTVYNNVDNNFNIKHRVIRDSITRKFPKITVIYSIGADYICSRCASEHHFIKEEFCEVFDYDCDLNESNRISNDVEEVFIEIYTHM